MDQFNHPYFQTATQSSQFWNSNKTIGFLLSVSLLSVIYSHSSFLPFLLHSFHVYISTSPLKLFSHSIDKNYMFLLCNGLLVFIVKISGLVGNSPSGNHLHQGHVIYNRDSQVSGTELSENKAMDGSQIVEIEAEEEEERGIGSLIIAAKGENRLLTLRDEGGEQGNSLNIIEESEDDEELKGFELLSTEDDEELKGFELLSTEDDEELKGFELLSTEDDEELKGFELLSTEDDEELKGFELLSTEELNKRCDDFIRRMKEEIKFGA
ncbi:hypothetical protein CJ030_MR6G003672 [Morella rubra]|uniref:Uncharacterized protein n=1 Tax=Morella rubra TaxID=262757 RepID=A0A6A1V7S2_9ROSI|nr:hypothetical protein CJ030_MR6G003672 [Morella rubra]